MLNAEQLKCQIPSINAVKQDVIYCSTQATNGPEMWTTIAAIVTAIATVGLFWGAWVAWRHAKKNLQQMERDSHDQTRPYVFAQIVPSIGGTESWDLVVRNSGRTSARNLTMQVNAWPEKDTVVTAIRKMFGTPQTLPPGCSLRTYWFLGLSKQPRSLVPVGFDKRVTLVLHYRGNDVSSNYTDEYILDPDSLGLTPLGSAGTNLPDGASPEAKKLSEIVVSINNLRREVSG